MPEWPNGVDCKSTIQRFKSFSDLLHSISRVAHSEAQLELLTLKQQLSRGSSPSLCFICGLSRLVIHDAHNVKGLVRFQESTFYVTM
jgi:hypothetical protein